MTVLTVTLATLHVHCTHSLSCLQLLDYSSSGPGQALTRILPLVVPVQQTSPSTPPQMRRSLPPPTAAEIPSAAALFLVPLPAAPAAAAAGPTPPRARVPVAPAFSVAAPQPAPHSQQPMPGGGTCSRCCSCCVDGGGSGVCNSCRESAETRRQCVEREVQGGWGALTTKLCTCASHSASCESRF